MRVATALHSTAWRPFSAAVSATAHSPSWSVARIAATARGVPVIASRRWVRWSRPPVSSGTPRRRREMTTSVVSRMTSPTIIAPQGSAAAPRFAPSAAAIAAPAAMKPIGMLPPSPRKIRAGRARLERRNPRHAPARAPAMPASSASCCTRAKLAMPIATAVVTVPAAPSRLSMRLNALTRPTTQRTVTRRFSASPSNTVQPRSPAHSPTPASASTPIRSHGERFTRSSIVPTIHSAQAPSPSRANRSPRPPHSTAGTRNATMTALPPRYGVARTCFL